MSAKPRSRRADEDDFRAFVAGSQQSLLRLAFLLTGDHGLAEDTVQTAFVRLYVVWPRVGLDDPYAYTRRIVINANRDRWRRHRGRERLTDQPPEREGLDATSTIADRDAVMRALRGLTDKERRVVVLRFVADLSEAETATALDVARGTVKSTAHRALLKLRADPNLDRLFQESS
jgi:RNA polymerase sigma-70 factor (sigma-E family)